jgi:hypothetical protein
VSRCTARTRPFGIERDQWAVVQQRAIQVRRPAIIATTAASK